MAQVERQRENAKDNKRFTSKQRRSKRASAAERLELSGDTWLYLAALVTAFANCGGAVRVGYTRDGGALALGCYFGDEYSTEYVRPSENLAEAVAEIAEAWLPDGLTVLQGAYEQIRAK